MMNRVKDKVALVTGGALGLGRAIAKRLAEEGAKVVITDIQVDEGDRLAGDLDGAFIKHDVTNEKDWENVLAQVLQTYGALHILVNNAGIAGPMDKASPEDSRLSDWQNIMRINVEGVFLGCRAAIPVLRRSGGGAIINLSSVASLAGTPRATAYGASKAAVRHLTQSVAVHCVRDGSTIRCNSVHPGPILTAMVDHVIKDRAKASGMSYEQCLSEWKAQQPKAEVLDPTDIANAVLFLASDEAKHITGIQLIVDGGRTLIA